MSARPHVPHESMPWRNVASHARCRLLAAEGRPRQVPTTLLAKPLRHSPLDLILVDEFSAFCRLETSPDRLLNVDVIVNVFKRRLFRQRFKQLANFLFRPSH